MKIVEDFEAAVRADEMKGGIDPQDIPIIEEEYRKTKRALIKLIRILKMMTKNK